MELTRTHKISGSIYYEDVDLYDSTAQFASNFVFTLENYLYQNPLHLDTFKELLRMESEVLQMTSDLLSPDSRVYGSLTSGGTESIMLAIYTYKQYYSNRKRPNMYDRCDVALFRTLLTPLSTKAASTSTSNSERPV